MDRKPSIALRDRIEPARFDRFEIVEAEAATALFRFRHERAPERAAVKKAWPLRRDGFERARQRRLAQHVAERHALGAAHIERGPFGQEVRACAGEFGLHLVDRRHIVFGEREAVARELDRGREHFG